MKFLVLGVFSLVCLAIQPQSRANADIRQFENVDCWFKRAAPVGVTCGILHVPQDHLQPDERRFKLPVLRIKPRSGLSKGPPILFLNGGPGITSTFKTYEEMLWWVGFARKLIDDREFIVPEIRGTRDSEPSLDCPKLREAVGFFGAVALREEKADNNKTPDELVAACLDRLRKAGAPFEKANRIQMAHDMTSLVDVLGIGKVSLYGVSYGTTIAMTIMQDHPGIVEDAVLDSVYPPEATASIEHSLVYEQVVKKYIQICEADKECNRLYPDLLEKLLKTLASLKQKPLNIAVKIPDKPKLHLVKLDAVFFSQIIQHLMGTEGLKEWVPAYIEFASYNDSKTFKELIETYIRDGFYKDLSYGAWLAGSCYDLPRDFDAKAVKKLYASTNALRRYGAEQFGLNECPQWLRKRAPNDKRLPLKSDIPTLLLSGGLDPFTPPHQARLAARGLSRSYLFEFRAKTHSFSMYDDCAMEIMWDFWKDHSRLPQRSCADIYTPRVFETYFP